MTCTGLYVLTQGYADSPQVAFSLSELRAVCDRLVIVAASSDQMAGLDRFCPDNVTLHPQAATSYLSGLRIGLLAEIDRNPAPSGPLIVTGDHVLAPIVPVASILERIAESDSALFAPYWRDANPEFRVRKNSHPNRIPFLDFAVFTPVLLADEGFRDFWQNLRDSDQQRDAMQDLIPLAKVLEDRRRGILYPVPQDFLHTSDPRLYEVHRLVEHGCPCLPLAVLSLDPLLHDIHAILLRPALDILRRRHPTAYGAAIRYACHAIPMREFNANADQFEVFPLVAADPEKTSWVFGTVAVFIHAYYPEMIAELAGMAANIPADHHLFVSTASAENRQTIETYLLGIGYDRSTMEVRVVDQNRGRDMSSLFITFRDVILDGRYEVALRLHSKRTPQVSPRVSEEFKTHLFENLVGSPGYVSNLLDKMEAEPDIGLVIPPLVHIGFSTLGHSWFNNYPAVLGLVEEMGFDIPLDTATPVAPNGTMYWFRTAALRRMFEWPWSWEDYNKEPHHVDGGLAHAQERLIGYCAQAAEYRVLTVMTPRSAARNYAKLEYKMQRIMSHLTSGNVVEQDSVLLRSRGSIRGRLFVFARGTYGRIIRRWPAVRRWLRPVAQRIRKLLS